MFLKIKNQLSVVITSPSQCQCNVCVCFSSCRIAAAVDKSAAVPPFLAGLSPASAPAAAAAAAAVCCCCSHSLLRMLSVLLCFVVLMYAVRGFFHKISCFLY